MATPAAQGQEQLQPRVVWTLSFGHLVNDMLTSLVAALAPIFTMDYHFTFGQVGAVALVSNLTSSVSQPIFGGISDKRPLTWLLAFGVFVTGLGTAALSLSHTFLGVLFAVGLCGFGSASFHPEAARAAHLAAGNRKGLAQSIFQVGGNLGFALGPAVVAGFIAHTGMAGTRWMVLPGLVAALALATIYRWYSERVNSFHRTRKQLAGKDRPWYMVLLVLAITVRSWVQLGIAIFLPLYFIHNHRLNTNNSEWCVFVFLLAGALGTFIGGPLSEVIGKKSLMSLSMVISVPLALLVPYVHAFIWILVVLFLLGFTILASFAVGVVYGQELMPTRIGMASGLIIGFSIGAGGIGASVMGQIAQVYGLSVVLRLVSWLPLLGGVLTLFLPGPFRFRRA